MVKEEIDYEKIGLKVGLEIHQQLKSNRKLFCYCKPNLIKNPPDRVVIRYMRPTLGETGEIDEAAKKEFKKRKTVIYETYRSLCPYEVDEIPPYDVDMNSLKAALLIAKLFKMEIPDILSVSRKQYLDGSVPSGFQRTILVALNGELELTNGKKLGIEQICLEEDAARKIEEDEKSVVYRVDRLGIPLIEITTEPMLNTPMEVLDAALRIGAILRAAGVAKRGLGTVRQDINISINGGARVEIKGVQKPEWFEPLIINEIKRQLTLINIKEELSRRGVKAEDLRKQEPRDISNLFKETKAKFIKSAIKKGEKVLAIKLPKFKGILGTKVQLDKRFGKEIAERVMAITGLKGIIHTDELPAYGISEKEVAEIFKGMDANPDEDCIAFVIGPFNKARDAIKEVKERALQALIGVPEETRRAHANGTTSFERPLGTAARLYPDTDSPPIIVARDMIHEIEKVKVEMPWTKIERYVKVFGLSEKHAKGIIFSEWAELFEELVAKGVSPKLLATTIVETFTSLKRENLDVDSLSEVQLRDLFLAIKDGRIAKEAIVDVLTYLCENKDSTVNEAIEKLGLETVDMEYLERVIKEIMDKNRNLILERGERAFSPLMGHVMKEVRGKIDGKIVSKVLKEKLKEELMKNK